MAITHIAFRRHMGTCDQPLSLRKFALETFCHTEINNTSSLSQINVGQDPKCTLTFCVIGTCFHYALSCTLPWLPSLPEQGLESWGGVAQIPVGVVTSLLLGLCHGIPRNSIVSGPKKTMHLADIVP